MALEASQIVSCGESLLRCSVHEGRLMVTRSRFERATAEFVVKQTCWFPDGEAAPDRGRPCRLSLLDCGAFAEVAYVVVARGGAPCEVVVLRATPCARERTLAAAADDVRLDVCFAAAPPAGCSSCPCLIAGPCLLWAADGGGGCELAADAVVLWSGVVAGNAALAFVRSAAGGGVALIRVTDGEPAVADVADYVTAAHAAATTALDVVAARDWSPRGRHHGVLALAATSLAQLVEFADGRPRRCCRLPFRDAAAVLRLRGRAGQRHLAVRSASGDVAVVAYEEFRVVTPREPLEGVAAAVVGDFLGDGNEQLLCCLRAGAATVAPPCGNNWILTDLQGVRLTSGGGAAARVNACEPESLRKAAAALERRRRDRQRLIASSWAAIRRTVAGGNDDDDDDEPGIGLVPLFGDRAASAAPPGGGARRLTVQRRWVRVVRETLVVGVELLNEGATAASSLSLSLAASRSAACTSHSRVVKITGRGRYQQHAAPAEGGVLALLKREIRASQRSLKRQRTEAEEEEGEGVYVAGCQAGWEELRAGERGCVVARTPLPDFTSDVVTYDAVVSYVCGGGGEVATVCATLAVCANDIAAMQARLPATNTAREKVGNTSARKEKVGITPTQAEKVGITPTQAEKVGITPTQAEKVGSTPTQEEKVRSTTALEEMDWSAVAGEEEDRSTTAQKEKAWSTSTQDEEVRSTVAQEEVRSTVAQEGRSTVAQEEGCSMVSQEGCSMTAWEEEDRSTAALNLVQTAVRVDVRSLHTNLARIMPALLDDAIVAGEWLHCQGALLGARLHLLETRRRRVAAVMYGWSASQVALLARELYAKLPADVSIVPRDT
ncbi:PREDICTED: uncharacterized protein LOC106812088 [Priapulus caudatus]|uniref:Uncharacterized protein LOC106812088 n=1 Tax=Priapulus caudatus TaxID=37621 RepID=A0ABM1EGM1_PRICU|nr:PREDICTED: uncharacterized protein LOC106812088 [Priapulus caudatus]